ncbi:MAG: hypothetical protein EZS28_043131, partial [Streblomastix strix]
MIKQYRRQERTGWIKNIIKVKLRQPLVIKKEKNMKFKTSIILICGLLILVLTSCVQRTTYTITWKNYDGTVLEIDSKVLDGIFPTFDDVTPSRPSTETETYEFVGWDPAITAVTSNQTYTAKFNVIPLINPEITFTIIWKNADG